MALYVCSLKSEIPQSIPADGKYHLVRFPYGSVEPYDVWDMHAQTHPDGYVVKDAAKDDRSSLIWPKVSGWATLTAMLFWASGDYTEIRDQFVRDPLGLAGGEDTTATEDYAKTPGGQYRHKTHQIFVNPATPLALRVRHNGKTAATLDLAEFKVAIETDVLVPTEAPVP